MLFSNKKIISIVLVVVAVILGVVSFVLLPEVVTVQVGLDGRPTNTMPKVLAVLVPFAVTVAGAVINYLNKDEKNYKGLILSVVGVIVTAISLIVNL